MLKSYYQGRVLANDSAMSDPIVLAVLEDMKARDFRPLPTHVRDVWYISDYD